MPRYQYHCKSCKKTMTVFHLSDEKQEDCIYCEKTGELVKLLNKFTTKRNHKEKKKIGQVTEEFIKDAKRDLNKQKEELEKDR